MKMQLDANALQLLLSNSDGEVELEMRQAVLEEFAKRHIKSIANSDIIKAVKGSVKSMIDEAKKSAVDEVQREYGDFTGGKFQLDQKIRASMEVDARMVFDDLFTDVMKQQTDRVQATIDTRLDKMFDRQIEHYIEKEVNRRLDEKLESIRSSL